LSDSLHEQEPENRFQEADASALLVGSLTVLIVDDRVLVRSAMDQALTSQPQIKRVVMAQNYVEAEKLAAQLPPDIIWLDLHIGHSNSIAEIGRLRKLSAASHIIAIDDEENEQQAFAAIMAGAQGYCSKQDVDPGEIMAMVRQLYGGIFVLRPALLARLMQLLRDAALPLWRSGTESGSRGLVSNTALERLAQLTTREHEILELISQGDRDRDIAKELSISEKTVQKHVQSILSKLGTQNRTEAAYLIHSKGLVRNNSE
jgi:DNA-binding NarL/FixJ family response regulator